MFHNDASFRDVFESSESSDDADVIMYVLGHFGVLGKSSPDRTSLYGSLTDAKAP